jgi:hypothetical protein
MKDPLYVEVIAFAPTAFYHCTHCEVAWREMGMSNQSHREQVTSSLPQDLAQDYQKVSDWVREIFRNYQERVVVKVIDAASAEGLWKSLRYGMRRYPVVIVDRKARFSRDELGAARQELAQLLESPQVEKIGESELKKGGVNR